jgi:hypothetical protein
MHVHTSFGSWRIEGGYTAHIECRYCNKIHKESTHQCPKLLRSSSSASARKRSQGRSALHSDPDASGFKVTLAPTANLAQWSTNSGAYYVTSWWCKGKYAPIWLVLFRGTH